LLIIQEANNVKMPNLEENTGSKAAPTGSEPAPEGEAPHTEPPHEQISSPVHQPIHPFPSDLEISSSVGVSHHSNEELIIY
jgi:hypothetical protein